MEDEGIDVQNVSKDTSDKNKRKLEPTQQINKQNQRSTEHGLLGQSEYLAGNISCQAIMSVITDGVRGAGQNDRPGWYDQPQNDHPGQL